MYTLLMSMFFFNDTATSKSYTYGHTLSLHDALPISSVQGARCAIDQYKPAPDGRGAPPRAPPPPSDHGPWHGDNGVRPGASGHERRPATIPPVADRNAPRSS